MKHIFYLRSSHWLALLVCCISICSWAQSGPFNGANTIVLSTNLADKDAYQSITEVLRSQHISFTADGDVLLMHSESNSTLAGKGYVFKGQLSVNTGIVKLTGRILDTSYQGNESVSDKSVLISYSKSHASLQRMGFVYMDDLARKLQLALQGSIMYKYQKDPI
jgi:hypothetical protein